MTRLLPAAALLLTTLFALIIAAITVQPYVDSLEQQFGGCGAPCWQGIQPGTTTREDALTHINGDLENPLCYSRTSVPCEMFQWAAADAPRKLTGVQIQRGLVYSVSVKAPGFTLASVLLTLRRLGHPLYDVQVSYNLDRFYLWLTFSDSRIGVSARATCPTSYGALLGTPVDLIVIQLPDARDQHAPMSLSLLRETVFRVCER